ncbi:hypothetical protein A3844_14935 [Paenibacillus helianthi]|uniref:Uncharacterized protein n=1 Tax=Paenibacillus helianthi TaxID=1349432 RepID=A0ABX3ERH0_9BACL|nr:hypothetical protein [Paenibacillus helianthi]OKP86046.1 hypothetical protein A3844_14935 [Paenibacillus helianthi]
MDTVTSDQKRQDFVQSILGKYGITRWRSRFQNLILRQFPLLFTEPEVVKSAGAVIHQVSLIQHTHIHQSIIHPLTQVMLQQQSPNRKLQISTGSSGAAKGIPDSYPGNQGSEQNTLHGKTGNLNLIHALQARVSKQQNRDVIHVTTEYRTIGLAESEPEPISPQDTRALKRTAETRQLHLSPVPESPAGGTEQVEQHQEDGIVPHARKSRQHEFLKDDIPQPLRAVHQQLHTLRTHTLFQAVDALNTQRHRSQKRELAANRDAQSGQPPAWVLKNSIEVVSSSGGTAANAQHNSSPWIFMPSQDFLPSASPGIHLGLGPGIAAVLEKMESRQVPRNPLPQESASLLNRLQPLAVQPILLLAAPLEPQGGALRQVSTLLSSTARRGNAKGLPADDPIPGLIHMAGEPAVPSAQRRSGRGSWPYIASPSQEEMQQPAGRHSSLILRKQEAPKATGQETVQPLQEVMPQEQASQQIKAQPSPRAAAPAAKMDTAELNQLAERVYQVLEKKMAIRKDRRGLR